MELPEHIDYMDVTPKQILSVATSLIPFLEHNDAPRALMGANMQRQAVPLVRPQVPLVTTGVEGARRVDSGQVLLADGRPGTSRELDRQRDCRLSTTPAQEREYKLLRFVRSNQGTCINQRPVVRERRSACTRAIRSRTARRPTTASWRSARTCSARS